METTITQEDQSRLAAMAQLVKQDSSQAAEIIQLAYDLGRCAGQLEASKLSIAALDRITDGLRR